MRRVRPKYQVFISSTYTDLRSERESVTWSILKDRHIPVGMEAMPATDDRGWKTIQRLIDESDYYVLILAGRYGSIDPSIGLSWTHREYEYAKGKGIPVLAFLRNDAFITKDKSEREQSLISALKQFVDDVRNSHKVEFWDNPEDLCTKVVQSLSNHIKDDEDDDNARPGWFRGDQIPSTIVADEMARLSAENKGLRTKIEELRGVQRPVIRVVDELGNELDSQVRTVELKQLVFSPSPTSFGDVGVGFMPRNTVSNSEWDEYADYLSSTGWFYVSLVNLSDFPAENVVVEWMFSDLEQLYLEQEQNPESRRLGLLHSPKNDPHVHLRHEWVSNDVCRVEGRIDVINPGATERMLFAGVRSKLFGQDVHVHYSVSSKCGPSGSGQFRLQVTAGESTKVTALHLKGM